MMSVNMDSLSDILNSELLEQLAAPAAVILVFMWLYSRRRSSITTLGGVQLQPAAAAADVSDDE